MAEDVAAGPEAAGAEVMAAMLDLSSPQATYKTVIDGPGFVTTERLVLTFAHGANMCSVTTSSSLPVSRWAWATCGR